MGFRFFRMTNRRAGARENVRRILPAKCAKGDGAWGRFCPVAGRSSGEPGRWRRTAALAGGSLERPATRRVGVPRWLAKKSRP